METFTQVMPESKAEKPLSGTRVVEIGTSVAGPYASWVLAGLGADVIKVERPGNGDDTRQWGGLFPDGSSSTFHYLNNEKSSITIDLRNAEECDWLRRFCVEEADVVIQNLRPGNVARYGLDAETLMAKNPQLIYCNLWPFGNTGPMKDHPGYDPLMQALSGIMSVTGEEGRPPIRVGPSIIDMGTGMWCCIGIISALKRRVETGEGCLVDASLYETSMGWMSNPVAISQAIGKIPGKRGSKVAGMAPYQAYECSNGHLIIAAPNDGLFIKVAGVLGHPEWMEDERFNSNLNRFENIDALNAKMDPILLAQTREHWREKFDEAGVPSAPVRNTAEMMADEQTKALGIIQKLEGEAPLQMSLPLSFNNVRPKITRPAPTLGQHNAEIKGKT